MTDWEETLLFRTLRRRSVPRRPVWLMRQAGRYLPEYRKVRKESGGFLQMLKTPELACEVTLQPIRRFGFDAAIVFSDILTIPDAMGMRLHFVENEGPRFSHPAQDEQAIMALQPPPPEKLDYVAKTCQMTRRELPADVPLIGFCGSPWTLACYMIDGQGGGDFWQTRALLHSRPDLLRHMLQVNAQSCAQLLQMQIDAGAQVAMIFDSWGGLLGGGDYEEFSLAPMRHIIAKISPMAPVIVFARNCGFHLPKIAAAGCDAAGVDWQTPLSAARRMVVERTAIQGNLDPASVLSDPETAAAATLRALEEFGKGPGHIFNLGHGINKNTPPENISALVETVQKWQADS